MAQNREPPAYQEYAAAMLANVQFRTMSLEERGLLYSLRLECWVNKSAPADPAVLARLMGVGSDLIRDALPLVLPFFEVVDSKIISPELEDYRTHLAAIRLKQSEGGRLGAEIARGNKRKPKSRTPKVTQGDHEGNPQDDPRDTEGSLVKYKPVQTSKTQPLENAGITDPWIADYERASNGE